MHLITERLTKKEIKSRAEEFNNTYNSEKEIPIPLELIIESKLKIDIVPIPHLKLELENDAFISKDFTSIFIDQLCYMEHETRCRFSLAHEIGHYCLHKTIYENLVYTSKDEWKEIYLSIDDEDYGWVEFQANYFAGCLLIPDFSLQSEFNKILDRIILLINEAKNEGINRETYLESAVSHISTKLSPIFNVSTLCMESRIKKDITYTSQIP